MTTKVVAAYNLKHTHIKITKKQFCLIRNITVFSKNKPVFFLNVYIKTSVIFVIKTACSVSQSMIFLGDTTIGYMEVTDKEPYLIEGIRHSGEQTKGACLVPKRALNVMQGEVNRILQLTSNSVIPITYQVPRKTYRYDTLLYE